MKKEKSVKRKVRNEHGYPVLYLGKQFADLMGRELILDRTVDPNNPFAWEIRVKPAEVEKQVVKRDPGRSKARTARE